MEFKNIPPTADDINNLLSELRHEMNDPTNIEKFVQEGRIQWINENFDRLLKGEV